MAAKSFRLLEPKPGIQGSAASRCLRREFERVVIHLYLPKRPR